MPLSMKKGMTWQAKKESDGCLMPYKEEAWLNSMTSRKEIDQAAGEPTKKKLLMKRVSAVERELWQVPN